MLVPAQAVYNAFPSPEDAEAQFARRAGIGLQLGSAAISLLAAYQLKESHYLAGAVCAISGAYGAAASAGCWNTYYQRRGGR